MHEIDIRRGFSFWDGRRDSYTHRTYCPKFMNEKLTWEDSPVVKRINLPDQFYSVYDGIDSYLYKYNWNYNAVNNNPLVGVGMALQSFNSNTEVIQDTLSFKFDTATLLLDRNNQPIHGTTLIHAANFGLHVTRPAIDEDGDSYTKTLYKQWLIPSVQFAFTYEDQDGSPVVGTIKPNTGSQNMFNTFFPRAPGNLSYQNAFGDQTSGLGLMAYRFNYRGQQMSMADMMLAESNYGSWNSGFYWDLEDLTGDGLDDVVVVIQQGEDADIYVIANTSRPGDREVSLGNMKEHSTIPGIFRNIDVDQGGVKLDWGDPNGDGNLDLIVVRKWRKQVMVRAAIQDQKRNWRIYGETEVAIPEDVNNFTWNAEKGGVFKFDMVAIDEDQDYTTLILLTHADGDRFVYIPYQLSVE